MIWDWFQPYYLWGFPTILFLIAAFKLQRKTNDYESKSPYIVFQGGDVATGAHYKQKRFVPVNQEIDRTEALGLEVYYAYVFVKNDPQGYRGEERTARKAVCAIEIYEANNLKVPFVSFWGSWRGTPQVMTRPSHAPFEDLAEFDLPPNGFPHRVDFALKFREDEDMYGYNDEAQRYSKDGRWEKLKLPPKRFFVQVRLKAIGLKDKPLCWYEVNHEGSQSKPVIRQLSKEEIKALGY